MSIFERVHIPSLGGETQWLNSEPLGPAELCGHVIVLDFWTLTCINWLRTEPYVGDTVPHEAPDAFTDAVLEVGGAK